jgi:flagella basal body P-ring formation protein FlgA
MMFLSRMAGWLWWAGAVLGALSLPLQGDEPAPKDVPILRTVEPAEITSILEQALRKEWKIEEGDLMVSFEKTLPEIRVPAGELSLRWVTRLSQPARRIFPQFELVVDGRPVGKHALPVHLEWFREVWVAESPLAAQAHLGTDVLKRQRVDALSLAGTPWMGDPSEDECSVVTPVASGSVVLERHVRRRPLIHRGETVAARFQDGSLAVEFQAVALEDGYRGSGVRVRSLLKPVEMRGKVLNETTVVVAR